MSSRILLLVRWSCVQCVLRNEMNSIGFLKFSRPPPKEDSNDNKLFGSDFGYKLLRGNEVTQHSHFLFNGAGKATTIA